MVTASFPIFLWIKNTLVRIVWYIAIPGTVAILGGYAFARLRFRGRDAVFTYLLSSMMRGQTEDVDRVRVTVHNLRGSHLVWVGWGLVMLGGALALASSNRSSQEGE